MAAAAGLLKGVAPPSIRRFELWLKKIGAELDPSRGRGSHHGFTWNGFETRVYLVSALPWRQRPLTTKR